MKPLRPLVASLLAVSLLGALRAADAKDIVVIDFTRMPHDPGEDPHRAYEYSFGDWQGKKGVIQIVDKGLLVNHVAGKGGVGENRGLDLRKRTKARVVFIVGNGNQADGFAFSLADRDGTDQAWDIPIKGVTPGTTVGVLLDLTKPSREEKPGKKPGIDLGKLESWQLKGNWQPAPLEVLVLKVLAVP